MKSLPSQLPILIEVAKEQSFSAAARNLGISAPAVSKAINKLEDEWKLKLFHRSSHSLSLTSAGRQLVANLEPAVMSIFSAIDSCKETNLQLAGTIKVNLPGTALGVDTILPHLMAFNYKHPDVQLNLYFSDASVDLISHGFDLGIGTSINQDSRLIAKRLFHSNIGLYASKLFVEKYGVPNTIEQLVDFRCLPVRSIETGKFRSINLYDGDKEHLITPQGSITVDSFIAAKTLLCSGWGIVGLSEWMIKAELEQGEIVPILQKHWGPQLPVYLYYSSREYMPQSVRTLIDYLSDKLN
ncbi:LysR family transcriptional regulator [Shewanella zhangzhouensis]|uniref:LysR family transcriptional regulator n=1 Tax=Shewanella zhangzhouensis TaxID=2864213 RepID=UPI001C657F88|nr:LysR family transcriptional regulator [Shewanella zhangzhouensis]QYK07002.1 LysR family transcriptional regulator [Shewanella zhangzhouensis]